jgi:diguanylate cyclase (GGDEF)-like protein/PAS domain S-box-containing protein
VTRVGFAESKSSEGEVPARAPIPRSTGWSSAPYFFAVGLLALLCIAEVGLLLGHVVEVYQVRTAISASNMQRTLADRILVFAEQSVSAAGVAERRAAAAELERDVQRLRTGTRAVPVVPTAEFIGAAKALRVTYDAAGRATFAQFQRLHERIVAAYDGSAQRSVRNAEAATQRFTVAEAIILATLLLMLGAGLFWLVLPLGGELRRSRTALEGQMRNVAANEARQRMILSEMPALVWTTDRQLTVTSIAGGALNDLRTNESAILGKSIFDVFGGPGATSAPIRAHSLALEGQPVTNAIISIADRVFQMHLEPRADDDGNVVGVIGVAIDVTEHQHHLGALRRLQTNLELAQSAAHVGSWEVDLKTGEVSWSKELFLMLGLDPAGKPPPREAFKRFGYPGDADAVRAAVATAWKTGKPYTLDRRFVAADGTIRWVEQRGQFEFDRYGRPVRLLGTAVDISARKEAERKLAHRATHDHLTGALNRSVLYECVNEVIDAANERHGKAAVIFIDLDNFKTINDQHGHANGDLLLGTLAGKLREVMRREDFLIRAGGDEFVALIGDADGEKITSVAERLFSALGEPTILDGRAHHQTASMGISMYPCDGANAEQLVHKADSAMYEAKKSGKNSYRFYAADMEAGDRQESSPPAIRSLPTAS